MVPLHVADPTVIVAGRVVGIRSEERRSCCRPAETVVGTAIVVALFVSGARSDWAADTVVGNSSILGAGGDSAGRRRIMRKGPCIGAEKSNAPLSWRTS